MNKQACKKQAITKIQLLNKLTIKNLQTQQKRLGSV